VRKKPIVIQLKKKHKLAQLSQQIAKKLPCFKKLDTTNLR